jgi:hypothetical protein
MQSIFSDSFDRPDNTNISDKAPMGLSYTEVAGDFQIVSGKLKAVGLNNHLATLDIVPNSPDYSVRAIVATTTGETSGIGLMLRYIDADNFYYARISTFGQTLRIYKRVAGTDTQLGSYSGGYVGATDYTLTFEAVGTALKAYVNGVERVSVTDSDLTAAGKAGFWTDYGNSTFNDFILSADIALDMPAAGTDYSQWPLPTRSKGWSINSVDFQVVAKSNTWNQDQTKRRNEYQAAKNLRPTHVAIAVPYDNLTKYTNYVADARNKGLKVFHRPHWNAWEGDNAISAGLSRQDYLTGAYLFIIGNPDLFEDGDMFGMCVEPSNANNHGNYTFRTPETSEGDFDIAKYNQFLKDQVRYANAAFAAIGKRVYTFPVSPSLSLLNLAGQVLDSSDAGDSDGLGNADIVAFFGGILTIDHYLSDSYRSDDEYGAKLSSDLDKIHTAFPDCRIMIGEWGYHLTTTVSDQEQYDVFREALEVFASKDFIIGVNCWVHMGSNTASIFSDSGGTINANGRLCVQAINTAFRGGNATYGRPRSGPRPPRVATFFNDPDPGGGGGGSEGGPGGGGGEGGGSEGGGGGGSP